MLDFIKETSEFVHLCETIHNRLAHEARTREDRDLIEYSCIDLLSKLKSDQAPVISSS
jgi:hypothetical protein